MIRGAIELIRHDRVAGWIYAKVGSLRDQLVLAMCGPRCAGAGRADVFRRDLLEADLGDGYCGFHFAIDLLPADALACVVVKLAGSDVLLCRWAAA